MSDLELLRRYEPIVRFTQGEMFYPMPVDHYLERCSLWSLRPGHEAQQLAAPGDVDVHRLAAVQATQAEGRLSLRFVDQPLRGRTYQKWRGTRPSFRSAGRFARVGLGPRFLEVFVSLSFLLRGTVPGGTAAAAQQQYEDALSTSPGFSYYGRVVRDGGYVVLQYAYFYAMNDWRSSFAGVNDHEADWEQVFVFLGRTAGGDLEPLWFAAAAHDYEGDDLRWAWTDPQLTVVDGTHPVVYAGAGSHASYVRPGEYVTSVDVKFLRPLRRAAEGARTLWRDVLHQGDPEGLVESVEGIVRVPFVDYARGDGLTIGPGQDEEWCPLVIDEGVPWIAGYRGLWGLDTEDVFSGERAPAGPMYNRDGTVRRSWYDPVGWSGLAKIAPPDRAAATRQRIADELRDETEEYEQLAARLRDELPSLGMRVAALEGADGMRDLYEAQRTELQRREAELAEATSHLEELRRMTAASERHPDLAGGKATPTRRQPRRLQPEPADAGHRGRVAELWAAASSGLVLLAAVLLLALGSHPLVVVLLLVALAVLVDALLRGYVVRLLLNCTIALALLTLAVLVSEFFWQLSLIAIAIVGVMILRENLRELRGR
jgi:hypothetical protein